MRDVDTAASRRMASWAEAGRTREALAGLALVVGALAYWVVEAVAAAGWHGPGYSYADGYVTDLASRDCGPYDGRIVCSPRWVAVDVAWTGEGILVAAAGLLLAAALTRRSRAVVSILAVAFGASFALFVLFPKSASTEANGTVGLYWTGALVSLVAGNALAIALGRPWRRLGVPRAVGLAGVLLGTAGLVAAVVTLGWLAIGVAERISVYRILLWQIILGGALVLPPRTRRTGPGGTRSP